MLEGWHKQFPKRAQSFWTDVKKIRRRQYKQSDIGIHILTYHLVALHLDVGNVLKESIPFMPPKFPIKWRTSSSLSHPPFSDLLAYLFSCQIFLYQTTLLWISCISLSAQSYRLMSGSCGWWWMVRAPLYPP